MTIEATKTRNTWTTWMHVAGTGYAVAIWLFFMTFWVPAETTFVLMQIALTVGTVAFIGGWGRYLQTKKNA